MRITIDIDPNAAGGSATSPNSTLVGTVTQTMPQAIVPGAALNAGDSKAISPRKETSSLPQNITAEASAAPSVAPPAPHPDRFALASGLGLSERGSSAGSAQS